MNYIDILPSTRVYVYTNELKHPELTENFVTSLYENENVDAHLFCFMVINPLILSVGKNCATDANGTIHDGIITIRYPWGFIEPC